MAAELRHYIKLFPSSYLHSVTRLSRLNRYPQFLQSLRTTFYWVLALAIWSSTSTAQTNQFSGTFSLPQGIVAPAGGTVFNLATDPLDEFTLNSRVAYSATEVQIAAGQTSVFYTLRLDNSPVVLNKTLKFECVSGCDELDITTVGWWSSLKGVVAKADASNFVANTSQTIDIQMEPADVFAGSIIFPDDFLATGTELFTIEITETAFAVTARFSQQVLATENSQSVDFRLAVPADETNGGWNMSLRCLDCVSDLAAGPYYPTRVNGDPASLESSQQFFFQKNRDYTDIQFSLISLREPEVPRRPVISAISILLLGDDDS